MSASSVFDLGRRRGERGGGERGEMERESILGRREGEMERERERENPRYSI